MPSRSFCSSRIRYPSWPDLANCSSVSLRHLADLLLGGHLRHQLADLAIDLALRHLRLPGTRTPRNHQRRHQPTQASHSSWPHSLSMYDQPCPPARRDSRGPGLSHERRHDSRAAAQRKHKSRLPAPQFEGASATRVWSACRHWTSSGASRSLPRHSRLPERSAPEGFLSRQRCVAEDSSRSRRPERHGISWPWSRTSQVQGSFQCTGQEHDPGGRACPLRLAPDRTSRIGFRPESTNGLIQRTGQIMTDSDRAVGSPANNCDAML